MTELWSLLGALLLLTGNAFFVGAEFSLVSARRTQVEPRVAEGSVAARLTLRAMERVSEMMAAAQLGITICSLGLGAIGEPAVAHLLEPAFEAVGLGGNTLHVVSFVVAMSIVVAFHMVLGEMVPKNIAIAGPERSAVMLGPMLYAIALVFRPLIWGLNQLANLILLLLRVQPQDEVTSTFTREEVADLIAESRREGLLDEQQSNLLSGALTFEERSVADIALTESDLSTVDVQATVAEIEDECARTGYSRFPVTENGALIGYLHVKDLLRVPQDQRSVAVDRDLIRELPAVAAEESLRQAVVTMQLTGAHLAHVEDASTGRSLGLVTLEDALEEMVGNVDDVASGKIL